MNDIYETYRDAVDFFLVYIREAHPTDGWQVSPNVKENVLFAEPTDIDERAAVAGVCMLDLGFTMPTLLDDMDNTVDELYAALPERLYVVDAAGAISYRGIMGSGGFDVDSWLAAVEEQAALSR